MVEFFQNLEGEDWKLVWSDEFDGTSIDPNNWEHMIGDGTAYGIPGWGNNELQWYLEDSAELRDGKLVITAREESVSGKNYTSARINTRDRFAFRYGRIEASIRLPGGQGIWPAFWLLGDDIATEGWPQCGEIDIMEYRGQEPNQANGALHGPGYSAAAAISGTQSTKWCTVPAGRCSDLPCPARSSATR